MNRKLTIMFAPLDLVGVVNAFIGIAEVLLQRGHRIVFAVSDKWRGKLGVYGFEEAIIGHQESQTIEDPAKYWAENFVNSGLFGPISPIEKLKNLNLAKGMGDIISKLEESEPFLEEIVDRIKPDVIIVDNFPYMPSLMNCGIPWVWPVSCNPLYTDYAIEDERIPPMASGLPTNGDQKEWKKFREERDAAWLKTWNGFNEWVISKGCPPLEKSRFLKPSPYLNIYMFPKELDYTDIRQLPSNWHQFDNFMRSAKSQTFQIPEKLKNRSGKLIYLSLGSMGGADVQLMKKLVSILSKSEHRFIVSKGPLHDRYELADNMWGEKTVPQLKVLPIIDLYITHGGNNSLTECCFYGKPMIIMPLFYDQYDNAQRVQEKGFGIRLDPYECSETQLLESIDKILNDKKLALKLENMSKRIQTEKSLLKINDLIEGLVK